MHGENDGHADDQTAQPPYTPQPPSYPHVAPVTPIAPVPAPADEAPFVVLDGPPKPKPSKSSNRPLIRKVAVKAQELAETSPDRLDLLAAILASGHSLADITVAIFTAGRPQLQVIADLNEIFDADPMEAGVIAASAGRGRLKAMWRVVAHLNLISTAIPESDAKAAIALAHAVHSNPASGYAREQIRHAVELLGR